MGRVPSARGMYYGCVECRGRLLSIQVMSQKVGVDFMGQLSRDAAVVDTRRGRPCPECGERMARFATGGMHLKLEACPACYLVWLDPKVYQALPDLPDPDTQVVHPRRGYAMSTEAVEKLGRAQMDIVTERYRQQMGFNEAPDVWWKYVLAAFGVPVKTESQGLEDWPVVTGVIGGLMLLTGILTFGNLQGNVDALGLLPTDPFRMGGGTFITSFFLHGGPGHLLTNFYFLIVFGMNVEDYLGGWWYLLLVVVAALVGDGLHIMFDPRGELPIVGASGGLSGVLLFYAFAFPRARLGFFFWIFFVPRWITMSALGFILFWGVLQCLGLMLQLHGFSNVSALAHLGGAGVGLALWVFLRAKQKRA